jgi:hypothetical protein
MTCGFRCVIFAAVSGLALLLPGCGSSAPSPPSQSAAARPASAEASRNPVAKFIELVGFRISEKGAGKLIIRFGVVNHSDADIGDLEMNVSLHATTGKASDPPLFSFPVKVSDVGPESLTNVEVETNTKLRVYELPDWQFLRPDFTITSPR